ncbi:hypothetical protein [Heyndrickxia coagulans]|uniref:hypothetical protein n=1 Tax=Heyndrickxia coagulans TaxID=1398 RepID=UPI001451CC98|nr:hypothetical protein [Heyndrickxia coagulans]MED4492991.1 hypothetical protein [Heyndrickxia coagulans]MED4536334.1 hypothetical protein [Heyndrickxia coagulans]QJE31795.1 hypothetical protein HHU11_03505 [Heyndrickxia coagulans]
MEKQRVNMDINKELWKKVGIRAIELNLQKKEIVELALEKFLQEGNKMAKVFYEDILVGEVLTNRSLTVEEALEAIGFDEAKFIEEQGFDDIDYNDFRLE